MEPVSPILTRQEVRFPVPASTDGKGVRLYLVADDAGDGHEHDVVVWERPRLVATGMPDLLLRDVPAVERALASFRERVFAGTARSLAAAAEAGATRGRFDLDELARKHDVPPDVLAAWFDYLGLGNGDRSVTITSHLQGKKEKGGGYDFVNGWGADATPILLANSSDMHVRVPGNLKPHSVAMHPSPTLRVAAGWLSPVSSVVRVEGKVQPAHSECGNGVTWSLEVRRGATRQRLAEGVAQGANVVPFGPFEGVPVRSGDLVSLMVGPRDGNHSCDLTAVDLVLAGDGKSWDLAGDVSPDVLAGNPHADGFGNPGVWHFYTEAERVGDTDAMIEPGSLLAKWQSATNPEEKQRLARDAQAFLESDPPAVSAKDSPDGKLYRQLISFRSPLLRASLDGLVAKGAVIAPANLGDAQFGRLPGGQAIDGASLGVRAPAVVEVTLPAHLAEGCEFVTSGIPHPASGPEGSVQLQVSATRPGDGPRPDPARPILVAEASPARLRWESAFDAFRQMFPPALCYAKIVPVDEAVTLTLFYREDDLLRRLLLDDAQAARLDRLWDELRFISQDALTLVDAFQQLLEYASQDGDPSLFEPLRKPIQDRAAAFRATLVEAEPRQVDAAVAFASKAYRRPLSGSEASQLRALYRKLRTAELSHDDAWRLTLARVLVAPGVPLPGRIGRNGGDGDLGERLGTRQPFELLPLVVGPR